MWIGAILYLEICRWMLMSSCVNLVLLYEKNKKLQFLWNHTDLYTMASRTRSTYAVQGNTSSE